MIDLFICCQLKIDAAEKGGNAVKVNGVFESRQLSLALLKPNLHSLFSFIRSAIAANIHQKYLPTSVTHTKYRLDRSEERQLPFFDRFELKLG